MRVMLIGNPNAGQSTLFHALTHPAAFTTDVQEATGLLLSDFQFVDCPGFYSLTSGQSSSLAMQFVATELINDPPDLLLNVVNVTALERELLLTTQLMELGYPMVLVLTHMDQCQAIPDVKKLAEMLKIPVFPLVHEDVQSIRELCAWLQEHVSCRPSLMVECPDGAFEPSVEVFARRRYLESLDAFHHQHSVTDDLYQKIANISDEDARDDIQLKMMDARYQFVHQVASKVLPSKKHTQKKLTHQVDKLLLHRFWGWPIFLGVLWLFFSLAINIGGSIQQTLINDCEWFFKNPVTYLLSQWHASHWWKWMIVDGLGTGVSTMISFLPVMAFMNLFLILLEASGYMSRVAFLFERIMRKVGLPGKAFLPLLIGFGCNVPAIMSARMVDGSRDRLLTVLLSPFMSCSARLTIYAVFASLFFPQSGGLVVLSLYLLGMIMAILTGLLLRKFWLTGHVSPGMMDLPLYRIPNIKRILRDVYLRLKLFLIRSGALVLPFCTVLGTFQAAFQHGWVISPDLKAWLWQAWLHGLHPLFAPIGITSDNWPAAVSLLTGTMAKEIVVATLNTLYSQMPSMLQPHMATGLDHHWVLFSQFVVMPSEHLTAHSSRALMWAFGGPIAAYSYLLFVLLYIPCISTLAIIRQEVGRFWQWFAFLWSLLLAYSVASLFYQTLTFSQHPLQTLIWWGGNAMIWLAVILMFHHWKPEHVKRH